MPPTAQPPLEYAGPTHPSRPASSRKPSQGLQASPTPPCALGFLQALSKGALSGSPILPCGLFQTRRGSTLPQAPASLGPLSLLWGRVG